MAHTLRIGAMAGLLASAAMTITPAQAAELPSSAAGVKHNTLYTQFEAPRPGDSLSEVNEWRRWGRWRGRGWRRGWRGRRGVRAGDVLAGVAIIGGIAAIASAANNNNDRRDRRERRRDRDRDWQQDQELRELREQTREQQRELEYLRSRGVEVESYRGRGTQERFPETQSRSSAPIGIDGAIDTCANAVARDGAVNDVDGVERTGSGWSVRGTISNGEAFDCRISNDGQIESLNFGDVSRGGFRGAQEDTRLNSYSSRAEGQMSDDSYANARVALTERGDVREPLAGRFADARGNSAATARPAYPGGPIPGEAIPETIDGDL